MIDGREFVEGGPGAWRPAPRWLATPESLLATMRERGDRVAVVDGDERFTYAEVAAAAERLAQEWQRWGLAPGDAVAVYAPNSTAWAIAQLATARCRAIVIPVNVRARPAELAALLDGTKPRIVVLAERFMSNPMRERFAQAVERADAASVPALVIRLDGTSAGGLTEWSAPPALDRDARPATAESVADDEPFIAFWTSGTTGAPKSVVHAWRPLLTSVWDWTSMLDFERHDTVLVATRPFYYIAGNAVQLMGALIGGARLVLVPELAPAMLLEAIRTHDGTHLLGGPHMHGQVIDARGDSPAPTALRWASMGGDPPPADLVERLRGELGVTTVLQTYGMTELHGFATTTLPTDEPERMARDAGICMPGVALSIRDEAGEEVVDGVVGEIHVAGRAPWGSYVDGAPRRIPSPEWFPTGDLGRIVGGRIAVVGRVAGLLKVSGERVHVDEVESTMRAWPEVREVLAYGVPDDDRVTVVGAAVELAADARPPVGDVEALIDRAHDELSPPKRPRVLRIVPAGWPWPRNVAGKFRRSEAQAQLDDSEAVVTLDLRSPHWRDALDADESLKATTESGAS